VGGAYDAPPTAAYVKPVAKEMGLTAERVADEIGEVYGVTGSTSARSSPSP
jgi:hypothetical protein